ncbi:T9SS type A sorting domain-containing protein [Mesonia sp. K7]|uniref:T9SS type A sorting domain-containing protein n=1 Tax=Mesonia sp. K7 TaxID=2218606 RepID=UPI000DA733FC|nr:T9SS type A sorting domain-containing protein [Mesonia sp. K7]PZD77014.1 hypothetical protein DNG35_10255 [Mesonia sp. K7]
MKNKLLFLALMLSFITLKSNGQITENFDSGLAATYTTGNQTLSSGVWQTADVFQESGGNSRGGVGHAARLNDDTSDASLTTPQLTNGVGDISFWYRELNSGGGTFDVQISTDSSTFTTITSQVFAGTTFQEFTFSMNNSGNSLYIRIVNDNQSGHLIIDDFSATAFGSPSTDTEVNFATTSTTINEGDGTYNIDLTIMNEDATNATTADIVLISGDATDINNYTTQTVTFPAGSSANQTVTLTITDDASIEGTENLTFEIQNVAGGNNAAAGVSNQLNISLEDNDFPPVPDIIISEVADPGDNASEGRFIEIYNNGSEYIDLSNIYLSLFSNNNTSPTTEQQLSGVLKPGTFYVIGDPQFENAYSFTPDALSGVANSNGDDTYVLYYNGNFSSGGTVSDIYGEIGTDGTGEVWEYENSRAVRNNLATNPNNTWTASEWTITSADVADMTPGTDDTRIDYVYSAGAWSPAGTPTQNDMVSIEDNLTVTNLEAYNLTVTTGNTLTILGELNVIGDIIGDGTIVMESTSINDTATLGEMLSTSTISSNITFEIQRFIPGKRAFRFLSSPVTTTGTIRANWQEGQNNTGTAFPGDNINNNTGFGTHITGSTDGSNGFDATISGNPSLFDFENSSQTWAAVANTDVLTLERGKPYRLFVRGSRAIDLSNNTATADDTRLRMTGTIADAQQIDVNSLSSTTGDYNLIGNPYQSAIDMNLVLSSYSTDLNTTYYYIWDPNVNTRGAYVVVDVTTGSNTVQGGVGSSAANEYLQPNQAFFARTTGASPSLEFHQLQKVSGNLTATHKPMIAKEMNIKLFSTLNSSPFLVDGAKIYFDTNYGNQVDESDAEKLGNQDENLALVNGNKFLSIERRALPVEDEEIPFFNNNYRNTDYHFSIDLPALDNEAYLVDSYLQTQTLLQEGVNTYNFTVDENITESIATDRFKLLFGKPLGAINSEVASLNVYPNPVHGDILHITDANINGDTSVKIVNILGQQVYQKTYKNVHQDVTINNLSALPTGVYILKVTSNGKEFTQKIIKQ